MDKVPNIVTPEDWTRKSIFAPTVTDDGDTLEVRFNAASFSVLVTPAIRKHPRLVIDTAMAQLKEEFMRAAAEIGQQIPKHCTKQGLNGNG